MSFVSNARVSNVKEETYVAPKLSQRLENYLEPFILYYLGLFVLVKVVLRTSFTNPSALRQFSRIRDKAFSELWQVLGSGNVPLFRTASGVVLDIGPADGRQIANYTSSAIKAMYGIEPCTEFHPDLKIAGEKAGFGSKFHVLGCGAQSESLIPALTEAGLLKGKVEGVFDTIIASKVLCSVPDCEETIAGLYALLKPGGRMLVCEHIKNPWRTPKGSWVARAIQEMFMLQGWSYLLSGCSLNRSTDKILKKVADRDGGWKKMDLELVAPWGTIPLVLGELVKKD